MSTTDVVVTVAAAVATVVAAWLAVAPVPRPASIGHERASGGLIGDEFER